MKFFLFLVSIALAMASHGAVLAAVVGFQSKADFDAALLPVQDARTDVDFDAAGLSTTIASGTAFEGITFTYGFGGISMAITDGNQFGGGGPFNTTSGTQFLGTSDADVFQDGDDFSISFDAANAVGLQFITADTMFNDDIVLTVDGFSVGLDASGGVDLGDGGFAYYLGVIDSMSTFTDASITADGGAGGPFFFYSVDDITTATTTAVPEPSSLLLTSIVGALACISRRRRHKL